LLQAKRPPKNKDKYDPVKRREMNERRKMAKLGAACVPPPVRFLPGLGVVCVADRGLWRCLVLGGRLVVLALPCWGPGSFEPRQFVVVRHS
jgi:hypothetical protein